jgi:hypothetical protein
VGFASILKMFDKLDDIIYKPIETATEWAKEPLRDKQHKRDMAEKEKDATLAQEMAAHKLTLKIKKETEIIRVIAEIEELKKNEEFKRMKAVSEAIIKFQKELTQLNVDAINSIGNIQLGLRENAQKLVYERTIKYKELQDLAMQEAMRDLQKIDEIFGENEMSKKILINAVDKRLANIIDTAYSFLQELNTDIRKLNQNIDILVSNGDKFIKDHLSQLRASGFSSDQIKRLKSNEVEIMDD